jgi:quinol monooxygenase YgiN
MNLIINIYYKGQNGGVKEFVKEMISSGLVERIRKEEGNLGYNYYLPVEDNETVLLIDKWKEQKYLDLHHKSEMMEEIAKLRIKYKLSMKVEKYRELDDNK